jgi:nucleotide-binding universal stress UspA family protein
MTETTGTGVTAEETAAVGPPGGGGPHLVFGDDSSAAADVAWQWIAHHEWPGWRISVVTAQLPPVGPPVGSARSDPHPWEPPSPRRLDPQISAEETVVEHLFAEADPRLVLAGYADADVVVVGPRGRGLLKHLHIGSTAEWLASAHLPGSSLLVVRNPRPTNQVMLFADGSPAARQATRTLTVLPWIAECRISVVGIQDGYTEVETGVLTAVETLHAHGVTDCEYRLIPALTGDDGMDVGSTAMSLVAAEKPDLVAVGTRGLSGLRRLLLGSTASALLHHSAASVLVARAPEGEDADTTT